MFFSKYFQYVIVRLGSCVVDICLVLTNRTSLHSIIFYRILMLHWLWPWNHSTQWSNVLLEWPSFKYIFRIHTLPHWDILGFTWFILETLILEGPFCFQIFHDSMMHDCQEYPKPAVQLKRSWVAWLMAAGISTNINIRILIIIQYEV